MFLKQTFSLENQDTYRLELNFLVRPNEVHIEIESALFEYVESEYSILDSYLIKDVGRQWENAKKKHGLDLGSEKRDWKSYWHKRIATRLLIRAREGKFDEWISILNTSTPLRSKKISCEGGEFKILTSSGFMNLELLHSFHPEILGAEISAIEFDNYHSSNLFDDVTMRFKRALSLLEKVFPVGARLFYESVESIVSIDINPKLSEGKCVSLAVAAAPGVIALTTPPIILMAETVLHESAHSRLSAINLLRPLWRGGDKLVSSPFRSDLRPISGVLHQCYVLYWLKTFYEKLQHCEDDPLIKTNIKQIIKRCNQFVLDFENALGVLNMHKDDLTDFGAALLKLLQENGGDNC